MPKASVLDLPSNEKEFTIRVKGETSGKAYEGTFKTVCVPSIRQKADICVLETKLNQDLMSLDPLIKAYHNTVAQCKYRIISAPKWWIESDDGQDLLDLNVITEVWKQCRQAEREWLDKVWGPAEAEPTKEATDAEEPKK